MPAAEIGDAIHRIGAAWHADRISLATAVAQVREVDPTLTRQGATGQIHAWRTAPARYRADPGLAAEHLDQRRVGAAALRREPIVLHVTPRA